MTIDEEGPDFSQANAPESFWEAQQQQTIPDNPKNLRSVPTYDDGKDQSTTRLRIPVVSESEGDTCQRFICTRRADGLTDIDVVVVRDGKNLKGRLLGLVVGTIGKGVWRRRSRTQLRLSKPETARQEAGV